MLDEPVHKIIRKAKLLKARPADPVARAARRMTRLNVGAVLVIQESRLVGIMTERDIVFRVVAPGLDAEATRLAQVMTPEPVTIPHDLPLGAALVVMHRQGFRHLPVMKDGEVIGIVSARSALDPELEEFTSESSRRRHFDRLAESVKPAR
jgi:CBS domain-containing protein